MSNKTIKEIQEYLDGVKAFSEGNAQNVVNANEWYETTLNESKRKTTAETKKALRSDREKIKSHKVSKPTAGKMYTFGYNAKTQKTLSYWDQYPLIICLGVQGNRMYGVNLHYIPPKDRKIFLDIVMKYSSTKKGKVSNSTYLKINAGKIRNIKWVDHMLKQYLFSHVVQTFMEIAPKDWGRAILLKTQQFTTKDTGKSVSASIAYNDRNRK